VIGILLINLGTPEAPTENAVRKYLDVFLSDPYVITLPRFLRDFLVQKIILPKRPAISAHAYKQIWTEQGSPLLINSIALQNALQKKLGGNYNVVLGMRYSNPNIENAIEQLEKNNCEKIIVLPLYPQFANATTQSSLDVVNDVIKNKNIMAKIQIVRDFYNQNFYIDSFANIISHNINKNNPEFILFSYHGLPKRQCGSNDYREQCFTSTKLIASKLNLPEEKYQTVFQSRLGFTKWIGPYTDHALKTLREKNIKKLSVVCPSFVADCVETLEEINIRLRAQWMELGGEFFECVSCLNADEVWIEKLARNINSLG